MKYLYSLLMFFFGVSSISKAQNIIYLLNNKTERGKIWQITDDKIKFNSTGSPSNPLNSRKIQDIVLVFNELGDYLVFKDGKMFSDNEESEFIHEVDIVRTNDIIIDKTGDAFTAKIISEKGDFVTGFSKKNLFKKPKSELTAIIRKNGSHQLFVSAENAITYLVGLKPTIKKLLQETEEVVGNMPSVTDVKKSIQEKKDTISNIAPPDLQTYRGKIQQKVSEFISYLSIITNENTPADISYKSINSACKLFLSENANVETSSVNRSEKANFKIRDYLTHLSVRSGHFDKITVEYVDVSYASELKKGKDNNYYGQVTFVQRFKGFIDNEVVYGDITRRSIIVVLKQYQKIEASGNITAWDVFLSDIGVITTTRMAIKR